MHVLIFFLMAIMVVKSSQLNASDCGSSFRPPEYDDISVECGPSSVSLAILICPAMYSGYNKSLIILNDVFNNTSCQGTLDVSATPPVVRFNIPFTQTGACGSVFTTTSAQGSGFFSDFSNVQTVNMSGVVRSHDPTDGDITFSPELKYHYSCAYPLQYLVNEVHLDVSAASIAVQDTNGTFVSTLRLELFRDSNYTEPLLMTSEGIELRTKIYVEVSATNLTSQYNVYLNRCYASVSAQPTDSTFFNLFVRCSVNEMTTLIENGESHSARFSFPAFRFSEQQSELVSTYYLHCTTRLCETSECDALKDCGQRRRRDVQAPVPTKDGSKTLTAQIVARTESRASKDETLAGGDDNADSSFVGLAAGLGVLAFISVAVICVAAIYYKRRHY